MARGDVKCWGEEGKDVKHRGIAVAVSRRRRNPKNTGHSLGEPISEHWQRRRRPPKDVGRGCRRFLWQWRMRFLRSTAQGLLARQEDAVESR